MPEVHLCGVDEVPLGQARVFLVEGKKIALFHRPNGFFALDDHCPHRSGPLSDGLLDNEEVSCPWHQWSFRLKDGICSNIPGAAVESFPVIIKNDAIMINIK
jgi:nitrite reductase (NADH) small subunit